MAATSDRFTLVDFPLPDSNEERTTIDHCLAVANTLDRYYTLNRRKCINRWGVQWYGEYRRIGHDICAFIVFVAKYSFDNDPFFVAYKQALTRAAERYLAQSV